MRVSFSSVEREIEGEKEREKKNNSPAAISFGNNLFVAGKYSQVLRYETKRILENSVQPMPCLVYACMLKFLLEQRKTNVLILSTTVL